MNQSLQPRLRSHRQTPTDTRSAKGNQRFPHEWNREALGLNQPRQTRVGSLGIIERIEQLKLLLKERD